MSAQPASPARSALALAMAAAVAFLGAAMMLAAGRSFPALGGAPGAGQPGFMVLAIVVLLALGGVLFVALALKELLELRRRPRTR